MSRNNSSKFRTINYAEAARSGLKSTKDSSAEPPPKVTVVSASSSSQSYGKTERRVDPDRFGTKKPYERIPDFQPRISRDKIEEWTNIQNTLRTKQVLEDSFPWVLPPQIQPPVASTSQDATAATQFEDLGLPPLEFVGGIDISVKGDRAVVCLAIQQFGERVLYLKREADLQEPYKAGFQAFRETPAMLLLLEEVKEKHPEVYPQLLMVQGCGTWHFRKFGLASHLGVVADIPTIGIAKNLLWIRGEIQEEHMRYHTSKLRFPGEYSNVTGFRDRYLYGAVMLTNLRESPYLYISSGHRVSLKTAVKLVLYFGGTNGMPTPIKYADAHSRDAVGASRRNR